jgi:hypothetical protein
LEDESADAIDWVFTTAEFAAALSDDLVPRRVMPRKLIEGVPSTGRVLVRVRTDLLGIFGVRSARRPTRPPMRFNTIDGLTVFAFLLEFGVTTTFF